MEYILLNPRKAMVKTVRDLQRIYIKLDYYREKQAEKEIQRFRDSIKNEFKKIENAELTLIDKFRTLNESGQAMAMSYIDDLTGMNRYKLEV